VELTLNENIGEKCIGMTKKKKRKKERKKKEKERFSEEQWLRKSSGVSKGIGRSDR
jgi:hypothetical protein